MIHKAHMTPERQRIAIAEACGWKWIRVIGPECGDGRWQATQDYPVGRGALSPNSPRLRVDYEVVASLPADAKDPDVRNLPDYLRDLNAMHEAEEVLTQEQKNNYVRILWRIARQGVTTDGPDGWFLQVAATAAQRAEAFLRTLNLWEES